MITRTRRVKRDTARPPGPRGTQAAGTLARLASGRTLEACTGLFARYGDTVYLPVRPWAGLYIFSRPEQAEHVLAASQDNYVKPFTYRPLRMMLGDGLLTAEEGMWRRHRRIIQPVFSSRNVASFSADMDAAARRTVHRWTSSPVVDLAGEMRALTLDVVGRVLFGADLMAQAPSLGRTLAAGQRLALLAAPMRHRYAWIPFGGGKRGCIGAGFARQEAVLVLARLCRHYRLDLIGAGLPRPRGFVTLGPAEPVRMRLIRRA